MWSIIIGRHLIFRLSKQQDVFLTQHTTVISLDVSHVTSNAFKKSGRRITGASVIILLILVKDLMAA